LGSPCLAARITSIIWRQDASYKVFAPYKVSGAKISNFSVLRSFEQGLIPGVERLRKKPGTQLANEFDLPAGEHRVGDHRS
jgi:hypothetical protein